VNRRPSQPRLLARVAACALTWLAACGGDGASSGTKPKSASSTKAGAHDAGSTTKADAGTRADAGKGTGGARAPDGGSSAATGVLPASDAGASCGVLTDLPDDFACTGLYSDVASKELAPGIQAYTPAHVLWSDGADKERWILLPDGTQIDNTDPDEWHFPVGTKLWKQFSHKGHRVETRLFWKAGEGRWLKTAYHWNADETAATRFAGGDVDVAGDTYYIPQPKECEQCHKGRDDRALGFEQVSLGLPEAQGLTLAELVRQGLLTQPPASTDLAIGDDGTGKAAPALGWLHVNCGVSCHNQNSNSDAFKTGMFLRLPVAAADGSSTASVDSLSTTVNVATRTPRWLGHQRITPGSPENSFVYTLANTRNPGNMKDQMPPIASRVVDDADLALVSAWIEAMPSH